MLHIMMERKACRPALEWLLSLQVLLITCLSCFCLFTRLCLPHWSCPSLLI